MNRKINKNQKTKFIEAEKSFKKIQKEIKPFIKQRKSEIASTIGKWKENVNACVVE